MDILFESGKAFELDLTKLPKRDQLLVIQKIDKYCGALKDNPEYFYRHVGRPLIPRLHGNLESTLFSMKANRDIRVLLTVDDDPIFEQIIITLLRVVRHSQLDKAFKGMAESLYQNMLSNLDKPETGNG